MLVVEERLGPNYLALHRRSSTESCETNTPAAGSRPLYFCLQPLPFALMLPRILSKRYETYTPFANRQTPLAASRPRRAFPASSTPVMSRRLRSTGLPSFNASSQHLSSDSMHSAEISPSNVRRVRRPPSSLSSRNTKSLVHRAFQSFQDRKFFGRVNAQITLRRTFSDLLLPILERHPAPAENKSADDPASAEVGVVELGRVHLLGRRVLSLVLVY